MRRTARPRVRILADEAVGLVSEVTIFTKERSKINVQEIRDFEKQIAEANSNTVLLRWRQYRTILGDRKWTTEDGSLKQGKREQLRQLAEDAGNAHSSDEITKRIRCARAYEDEQQLNNAVIQFKSWYQLCKLGFPLASCDLAPAPQSSPSPGPSVAHHAENQAFLFDNWDKPIGLYAKFEKTPEVTLSVVRSTIAAFRARIDQDEKTYNDAQDIFGKLLKAVDLNENATIGEAYENLASFLKKRKRSKA